MRSVAIAEFLLSLVMAPDRAAATAGDLVETSRSFLEFWVALVRTCFGAVVHQLSARLFVKAVGIEILWALGLRGLFVSMLLAGGRLVPSLEWLGPVLGLASMLLIPGFVGYLLALALPGRELAAGLSITLVTALCVVVVLLLGPGSIPTHLLPLMLPTPAGLLPMLFGMLLGRSKWLRSQRGPTRAT